MLTFADDVVDWLPWSVVAQESAGVHLVHVGQQGTLSWSNAYNRRHAYARPRQPGLAACTSSSNMLASTLSAHSKKQRVSTTDKTWHQISKPEQPNGTPDVALQHCNVSSRSTPHAASSAYFSVRERKFQGMKVPGNEGFREWKFPGTKVLGYESSMNHACHKGTYWVLDKDKN